MKDYLSEAVDLFEYTRSLRRDFHRHPELGFQEVRTAGIVTRELSELGLEVMSGVAKTGVIAMIEGDHPGPVVLCRFDMDALPVSEETGAEYASTYPGLMHACGHDGHIAIGLTVARMLHARRSELHGSVKLVFQPAEEGLGGAELMIAEGVLENPKPDLSLSLHVWNDNPLGWVAISKGPVMAASETFKVRLTGRGGHGASPHLAVDPVFAAAQVISALQSIVSRSVNPMETAVVSVTSIHAGDTFNVIPQTVEMQGTIRSFEPQVRALVLERFNKIVSSVSESLGCRADIEVRSITPAVINDPHISDTVLRVAGRLLPGATLETGYQTMGSEDMAFMMQDIPGCYFFIGSANVEKGLDAAHHHPRFDFDEQVLPQAAGLMAAVAAEFLKGENE